MIHGTMKDGRQYASGFDITPKVGTYVKWGAMKYPFSAMYQPVSLVEEIIEMNHEMSHGAYVWSETRVVFRKMSPIPAWMY